MTAVPARNARPRIACLTACAALATLTACGGGGGGSDSGVPVVPGAAPITASNYEGVGQKTVTAAMYLGDSTGLVTGAQVAPGPQALFAFSRAQAGRMPGLFRSTPRVATGVTTTETLACTGGGSLIATVNDENGNGNVDVGDSVRLTASNCVEAGATLNGILALSFNAVSGNIDSDVYAATVAVSLQGLRAGDNAGTVTGNGDFTLTLNSTSATSGSVAIATNSLSLAGVFGGVSDTVTLQDWRMVSTTALSAGRLSTSTTVSGGMASTALSSGLVTVATVQPMVQFEGDLYPSSGQFTATGAASSRVRITAQSGSSVLFELDADGNGAYESSVTRLWSSLV